MAYRVLIIGCGAIAGGYDAERAPGDWPLSHAGAIARDERFELTACFDQDEGAMEAFHERWNLPLPSDRFGPLGAKPGDFDVIVISTPTAAHAEGLKGAFVMKPRLVFCEKPLASTAQEGQSIADEFAKAKIALAVNHTRRWAPDLVHFAEELREGKWGAVLSAAGYYGKGVVHNGGHMVDLMQMLLGRLELVATGHPVYDHWEHDPSVPAMLETGEGTSVCLHAVDCRALTRFEFEVTTERGIFAMRDGGFRIEERKVADSVTFAGYRQSGDPTSRAGRYEEAMTRAYANIADHLDHGTDLASTCENALAAQRLCEQIRTAATAT